MLVIQWVVSDVFVCWYDTGRVHHITVGGVFVKDNAIYYYDLDVIRVYFACAITEATRKDRERHGRIIDTLTNNYRDCEVLTELFVDPYAHEADMTDQEIFNQDCAWLAESYAVIAEVGVLSHGVGVELGMMSGKKPVLCLCLEQRRPNLSAMIAGNKEFMVRTYTDIADLPPIFDEFFDQVRKFIKHKQEMLKMSLLG